MVGKNMKKFINIVLIAAIICTLSVSCKDNPVKSAETEAPVVTEQATEAPTEVPTEEPEPENVAKVILLLGQSNAVGATLYEPLRKSLGSDGFKALTKGFENVRIVYFAEAGNAEGTDYQTNLKEKKLGTYTVSTLFSKVKLGQSWTNVMFGPEVGMAQYLTENCPDETFYIIKVAKGSITLKGSFTEGGYCYEKMKYVVDESFKVLEAEGYTPQIISICWMQGENEACSEDSANNYGDDLAGLAADLRTLYAKYAPRGGIAFIDAGISSYWKYYKTVNAAKAAFAETSDLNYYFDTMELGYTYKNEPAGAPDYCHFDSDCVLLLGQKFAEYVLTAYNKGHS